jgi:hypothetical protein
MHGNPFAQGNIHKLRPVREPMPERQEQVAPLIVAPQRE